MKQFNINMVGVAIIAVFLAACNSGGGNALSIASPLAGGNYTSSTPDFRINYTNQPASIKIVLNGFPVQSYFTFGSTSAVASGEALKDFLIQGSNTLQINPTAFSPKHNFTYDSDGPLIIIDNVSSSNPIEVRGLIRDPAGVKSLTLNGNPASISGETFTVTVDPADPADPDDFYTFSATDNINHTSSLSYAPAGREFTDSIKASVGQSALESLVPMISSAVTDQVLEGAQLSPANPVISLTWEGIIEPVPYGLDANLDRVAFETLSMNELRIREANDGSIKFDVTVSNVDVDLTAIIYGGWIADNLALPIGLRIGAVDVTGRAHMGVTDRKMELELQNVKLTMDRTRISNLLGIELADYEPTLGLLDAIINMLDGLIGGMVADKINAVLADQMEFVIRTRLFIQDVGLAMDTSLESLGTQDGHITVGLGGGIWANPVKNTRPVLGSIYNDDPTPDAGTDTGNLTAVIAGNFINQAVMAAFQSGLTDITLLGSELHLGAILNHDMGVNGNTRIRIAPSSPANFTFAGENIAVANLSMYNFDVLQEKKIGGVWEPMVRMNLDFRVAIALDITEDNAITINLLNTPDIDLKALDNGYGFNISASKVDQIIDIAVPLVLARIDESLLSIKLPTVGGFGILPEEIKTVGDSNNNLSFSGTILTP
jgi:hypothetical protein